MKTMFRIFLFAFVATATFSGASCNRREPATADAVHPENTDSGQYEMHTPTVSLADEIVKFPPLADNERFAFAFKRTAQPIIWGLTLYAVRGNDIESRRKLFTWEDVADTDGFQFTSDFRTVFFAVRAERQQVGESLQWHHLFQPLYMANGVAGEVKRLPMEVMLPWRASKDGRFVAFINIWQVSDTGEDTGDWDREKANIFVFEVETGVITQIAWKSNMHIEGGWSLYRYDNIFLIHGSFEKGKLAALAELNPTTMELRTLVDLTDSYNRIEPNDETLYLLSKLIDEEDMFGDDVLRLWDPTIRLR
jgi:hypothetical protein